VHLYYLDLARPPAELEELTALLSPDEKGKASRFQYAHLRRRYIAGRGQLRLLLSRYLDVPPASIAFAYGATGKPGLAGAGNALTFNLAHSEDLAVLAFAQNRQIGVDVERLRELPDMQAMAQRYFALPEQAELLTLPAGEQLPAFYRIWTRKEAFVKATGAGLARALTSFVVSCSAAAPVVTDLATIGDAHAIVWTMAHLDPAPGYVGALVVEGDNWQLVVQGDRKDTGHSGDFSKAANDTERHNS
jgi:4'-phosphopantetheinyl transferase